MVQLKSSPQPPADWRTWGQSSTRYCSQESSRNWGEREGLGRRDGGNGREERKGGRRRGGQKKAFHT